jgi:hypothetical protein
MSNLEALTHAKEVDPSWRTNGKRTRTNATLHELKKELNEEGLKYFLNPVETSNYPTEKQSELDHTVADQVLSNLNVELNKGQYETAVKVVETIPNQVLDNPNLIPAVLEVDRLKLKKEDKLLEAALIWLGNAPVQILENYKKLDQVGSTVTQLIHQMSVAINLFNLSYNQVDNVMKVAGEIMEGTETVVDDPDEMIRSFKEIDTYNRTINKMLSTVSHGMDPTDWTKEGYEEFDNLMHLLSDINNSVGTNGDAELKGDESIENRVEAVKGNTQPMEMGLAKSIIKHREKTIEPIKGYKGNTYWKAYGEVINILHKVKAMPVIEQVASGKIEMNQDLVKAAADGRYSPVKIAEGMIANYLESK